MTDRNRILDATFARGVTGTIEMGAQKRGDDAADHAPQPKHEDRAKPPGPGGQQQDAPNYDEAADDRQALKDEDVSSANDE